MSNQNKGQANKEKPVLFYGYVIVIATFCITLIAVGIRMTYGIFFNPMAAEFKWDSAVVSSVFSLSILIEGTFGMIMGRLNDKIGPRVILTICGCFLGLGYFLMAQVHALWQMYFFYGIFIGIGMGGLVVPILTTISRWFITRRAAISGIVLSSTGIGTLILSPLVERIISNYDWRTAYLIMSALVFVIVVIAAQFLRKDPATMGLSPYLKSTAGEVKTKLQTMSLNLKQAIFTRQFWLMLFILFFYGYIGYSIVVHLVPDIIGAGISAGIAASVMAVFGAAGIGGRIIMGVVGDRIGNKKVYLFSFVIYAITLLALVFVKEVWFFYFTAALFGIGSGGVQSTQAAFIAELFGLKSHGEIFGVIGFASTIGGSIGPLVAGFIFDATGNYMIAFFICTIIAIAALVFTALIKPFHLKTSEIVY